MEEAKTVINAKVTGTVKDTEFLSFVYINFDHLNYVASGLGII